MNKLYVIMRKDITCLVRSPGQLAAIVGFAVLLVVLESFAFRHSGSGSREMLSITPGVTWLLFSFTSIVILNASFHPDLEHNAILGSLFTGVEPMLIVLSKTVVNGFCILVLQGIVIALHVVFSGVLLSGVFVELMFLVLLAALGFSALGTLLSSIAALSPGRELLLPIMLFPLALPLLTACVYLSHELIAIGSLPYNDFWFSFVCVYAVVSVTLSTVLFEYVVTE